MRRQLWTIIILIAIIAISCSDDYQKKSKGALDVIYVLSRDTSETKVDSALAACFSDYGIRTPEFQPFFSITHESIDKLKIFAHNKNLIVLADLSKNDLGAKLARRLLPEDHLKLAKSDSVNIFSIDDHYARDQVFILIAGTDMDKVAASISQRSAWFYKKFSKHYKKRAKEMLYKRREEKNLTRVFWDKYKWTVRIPDKFIPIKEAPDSNFVWIGADLPYRWFSVTWEEGMNTALMNPNGMMKKRQEIGDYYGGIKADTTFINHYYTKLNKWDALKMTGVWFSQKEPKGGPFISYSFYDSHSDRTYLLDVLIFDPSFEKLTDFYRQMEIMANTFSTEYTSDIFK